MIAARSPRDLARLAGAVCASVFVGLLAGAGSSPGATIDAKAIIDQVDRLLRGDSSEGELTMSVITRRWTRTLAMKVWSEGTEKALIKVAAPAKEAGTATLKSGADIWNYLPKIDRTIRVPTSMMMAAWMGSHFTHDDLVKESRLVRDYEIELAFGHFQVHDARYLPDRSLYDPIGGETGADVPALLAAVESSPGVRGTKSSCRSQAVASLSLGAR